MLDDNRKTTTPDDDPSAPRIPRSQLKHNDGHNPTQSKSSFDITTETTKKRRLSQRSLTASGKKSRKEARTDQPSEEVNNGCQAYAGISVLSASARATHGDLGTTVKARPSSQLRPSSVRSEQGEVAHKNGKEKSVHWQSSNPISSSAETQYGPAFRLDELTFTLKQASKLRRSKMRGKSERRAHLSKRPTVGKSGLESFRSTQESLKSARSIGFSQLSNSQHQDQSTLLDKLIKDMHQGVEETDTVHTERMTAAERSASLRKGTAAVEDNDGPPPIPPTTGPPLSDEQQRVVDLVLQGHNVFYTGPAGSGKSVVLRSLKTELENHRKRVFIVAPTNLAAYNVDAQTTWTYAGWTPRDFEKPLPELEEAGRDKVVSDRFRQTDVLVFEEISMLENHHIERLSAVMKAARRDCEGGDKPFGGVQVVVTGDVRKSRHVTPALSVD